VNLYVAGSTVGILRILIVLRASRLKRADVMRHTVAGQTKLADSAEAQQSRIRRAMRHVTGRTALSLQRRVLIGEGTLLVSVTLDAGGIRSSRQPGLLEFETAMRIVTITALHDAFENFVMERFVEIRLHFTVTTHAKLRLANLQHVQSRKVGLLGVRF
jgi:hypothetical protein